MKYILLVPLFYAFPLNFIYAQNTVLQLQKAYRKNSPTLLHSFFNTWKTEVSPLSTEEYHSLNDTLQNIYDLSTAFYQKQFSDKELIEKTKNIPYIILNGSIKIGIANNLNISRLEESKYIKRQVVKQSKDTTQYNDFLKKHCINGEWDAMSYEIFNPIYDYHIDIEKNISYFRPDFRCNQATATVYMTNKYRNIFEVYFGKAKEVEQKIRAKFLEHCISYTAGVPSQIVTAAELSYITFNKNFTAAFLHFHNDPYCSSTHIYIKEEGKWLFYRPYKILCE